MLQVEAPGMAGGNGLFLIFLIVIFLVVGEIGRFFGSQIGSKSSNMKNRILSYIGAVVGLALSVIFIMSNFSNLRESDSTLLLLLVLLIPMLGIACLLVYLGDKINK